MQQSSLIDAASPLFALITQIRGMPQKPDINQFRTMLLKELETFVKKISSMGFDQEAVSIAQYALCAAIDESIMMTPWGAMVGWAGQGLVLSFYQDLHAGEKFFLGLNKLAANPAKNIALLELFYGCILLGFRGRFAVVPNGSVELQRIQKQVFKIIEKERGVPQPNISIAWQGRPTPQRRPNYLLPFWWSMILCVILSIVLVSVLRLTLNKHFERDLVALDKLEYSPQITVATSPSKITLRHLLKSEIEHGYIELEEKTGRSVIRIKGDELFASGSSRINDSFLPVIERVTKAVYTYGGMVTVAGHTDNRPLKTFTLRSNLELSQQRAQNVVDIMMLGMSGGSITMVGRGDIEPLVSNDTPQNRAKNRRVEIRVDTLK